MTARIAALLALVAPACSFQVAASSGGDDGQVDADPNACRAANWQPRGWASRYPLAIQHARVTGAPGDMAVLVEITSAELQRARPSADDILFTASDGTSVLPFEIERFDPSTGALVAWVRLVTISSAADTPLYLYFENPSPPASPAQDVWGDYLAVWHLREDPGAPGVQVRDSTAHGNDLTTQGMTTADRVTGKIGSGFTFDGFDNGLTRPAFTLPARFTYEAWIRPTQLTGYRTIFDTSQNNRWLGFSGDDFDFYDGADHVIPAVTTLNVWHRIAAAYDGTLMRIYMDGVQVGTAIQSGLTAETAILHGGFSNVGEFLAGTVDELRISSVPLTADQIATSYANESAPDQFVVAGPVEHCR